MIVRIAIVSPEVIDPNIHPYASGCYQRIMECASSRSQPSALTQIGDPIIIEDPELADLVLFPIDGGSYGPCFEALRANKLYQKVYHRAAVYSTNDQQFPAVPGIYCGIPKRWSRPGWAVTAHYLSAHTQMLNFSRDQLVDKDIFYSFVGSSRTHVIRQRLVAMGHPQGVIMDATPALDPRRWWEKGDKHDAEQTYKDVIRRSQFVLCPRGVSPLSYRLFDAMAAAAVPVILADDIALPPGPDWDRCSVRVKEADMAEVPARLESLRPHASEIGLLARDAWERYFAPSSSLKYLSDLGSRVIPSAHSTYCQFSLRTRVRASEYTTAHLLKQKIKYRLFTKTK